MSECAKPKNIDKVFYPESIAVVGANRVQGTVPCDILMNILKSDFQGVVYPVSPRERCIAGVRAYKYVVDVPDPIDLAVLVFPSSVCHLAMEQCGQKGVKAAIIISAGFREVGEAGLKREQQVKEIADRYGISFVGPNCLGVINTDPKAMLNASFARKMPEEGSIAFLSQSGALCTAVLDYAQAKHIGFSKFVSFGNKADISEIDFLYYLKDDPKTKVILLYLEEITDGPGLMRAACEVITQSGKPVLALKSGRTSEGASAAASHTGSLAGSDSICDAAFKQAGIIRCNDIEEMFNKAIALTYQPLPRNNRVAIVTNAGGPGVLTTDAAIREGLTLAKFSEETTQTLRDNLPTTANIKNPVDVIGDARADRYNVALTSALNDDGVDGVLVILTPQSMTDIETIAREVCAVAAQHGKPLYASFMGEAEVAVGVDILQRNRIPHYILPESMCSAFACAYGFRQQRGRQCAPPERFDDVDTPAAQQILDEALAAGRLFLTEEDAVRVLQAYRLPLLANGVATSAKEAATLATQIGYPVVMKILSDDIIHKVDVGGVKLNIQSPAEAEEAYAAILDNVASRSPHATIKGVFVSKMLPRGEEVILGMKRDPSFGPVVMFGLGGTYVEIFQDVTFRVVPFDKTTARSMMEGIKSAPILRGARGKPPRDLERIEDCILRVGQLALECPQIQELDINPLVALEKGQGCFIADAKIML